SDDGSSSRIELCSSISRGARRLRCGRNLCWRGGMRLANAAPKDSQERVRQLRLAAADFQKAATAASKLDIKVLALNSLADVDDVYRMLAQFYARRVTALHKQAAQTESKSSTAPGERDENGVYRVGGSVPAPSLLHMPRMPTEAAAAGITGVVVAEIVIDT